MLKMSGTRDSQAVHGYVLDHVSGSEAARSSANRLLMGGLGISVVSGLLVMSSTALTESKVALGIGVILAGVPMGVLVQRLTGAFSLSRDQLRLRRFLIGRKGYVAPKQPVRHEQSDLFSVACSLVCHEPYLSPNSTAAAWHTYGFVAGMPGVAACVGWYGKNSQPVVFLYGDHRRLLETADEIWDLGHVRKFTATDKDTYENTIAGWKRQQLLPVALAYAPLPEGLDPMKISVKDLNGCTLLGAVGLTGSRGQSHDFTLAPKANLIAASYISYTNTIGLVFLALVSTIISYGFSLPVGIGLLHIIGFKLLIEPLILATFSWDEATKHNLKSTQTVVALLGQASLLAATSYAAFVVQLYLGGYVYAPDGSTQHNTALAVGLVAYGLGLLVNIMHQRGGRLFTKTHATNPLFGLALASALLVMLMSAYSIGPLLMGNLFVAICAAGILALVYEVRAYADRHHTREHIIELLGS